MPKSLTYTTYAGKVKLDRRDNGEIVVEAYRRQLDKGWHSQEMIKRFVYPSPDYAMAKRKLLAEYGVLLEETLAWVEDQEGRINGL